MPIWPMSPRMCGWHLALAAVRWWVHGVCGPQLESAANDVAAVISDLSSSRQQANTPIYRGKHSYRPFALSIHPSPIRPIHPNAHTPPRHQTDSSTRQTLTTRRTRRHARPTARLPARCVMHWHVLARLHARTHTCVRTHARTQACAHVAVICHAAHRPQSSAPVAEAWTDQ